VGIINRLKREWDSYAGNTRELDEQLGKLKEYEYAVTHKQRDWKDCENAIPNIKARIEVLRAGIAKEVS